jgi:uncharacterized protein YjgD (DUF1641 family)
MFQLRSSLFPPRDAARVFSGAFARGPRWHRACDRRRYGERAERPREAAMPELVGTNGSNGAQSALERLDARLARIERALERVEASERAVPAAVATAVDTLDGLVARLQAGGVDVDERLRVAARLLDRLTAPETARALEAAMRAAEQLPAVVATATDVLDSLAARAQDSGVDLDERLRVLVRVAERLTAPEALETLEAAFDQLHGLRALLRSGVLDPAPVAVVAKAGRALAEAGEGPVPSVGAFGALRAMGDPSVQRALGFLLSVARLFGGALAEKEAASAGLLPAKGARA